MSGTVEVLGAPPRRGNPGIGYVPQHQSFDRDLPLRGRDLVRLGVDGHRWGIGRPDAAAERLVAKAIEAVEAGPTPTHPSGGCRAASSSACGSPRRWSGTRSCCSATSRWRASTSIISGEITELIGDWQRQSGGTVLFVTHDVNPILDLVDRVLFVVNGRWAAGTPDEVLTSERMSDLYGSHVDVLRVHGRILVVSDTSGTGSRARGAASPARDR